MESFEGVATRKSGILSTSHSKIAFTWFNLILNYYSPNMEKGGGGGEISR